MPINTADNMPLFIVRDCEGLIAGFYQASKADKLNFRTVYGFAREQAANVQGDVEITCTARFAR